MSNFWEKDKPVQADQPPVQKVNFWDKDKPVEQAVPAPVAEVAPVAQPQAKQTNLADLVTNNPFSSPPGEKPIPPLLERPEYKNLWPETSYLKTPEPAYTLEMPDGQEVLISLDGKSMTGAVYNKKDNTFDFEYDEKQDPVVPSGVSAGGRGFYAPPTNVTKIKKVSPNEVVGYTNAADKLESAKIAFGRSIIPTASGFAGFAGGSTLASGLLALAPESAGATLIPLLAGAVTGFGTGMAGQSFQDRMFPLDKAQQLALASNPKTAGIAGFAPALIAAPTSPRTWANLASSTPGVAAKAATQLGSNAVMMGALGTGNDVGANLVAGKPALQGVGLGSILHHTGTGLLLGHPNKIGRVMEAPGRFTANAAMMPFGKGAYATPAPSRTVADLEAAAAEAKAQAQGQPGTAQPLPRITSEEARTKYPNGYDGEVVWPDGRVTGWSGTVEATVNISPSAPAAEAPKPAETVPTKAATERAEPAPDLLTPTANEAEKLALGRRWSEWYDKYGKTHFPSGEPRPLDYIEGTPEYLARVAKENADRQAAEGGNSTASQGSVPPRPERNGRDTTARDAWDEQYGEMRKGGRSHNNDGTPYVMSQAEQSQRSFWSKKRSIGNLMNTLGTNTETLASSAVKWLADNGWVHDSKSDTWSHPDQPGKTALQALKEGFYDKDTNAQPDAQTAATSEAAPATAPASKPVAEAPKPTGNVFELGVADLTERIRFIKGELGRRQAEVKAAAEEGRVDPEGQGRIERLNKYLAEAEGALERLKDRNAPRSELPPPAKEPTTAEVLAQKKAEFDKLTRQLEAAQRSQRSMKGGDEQIALLEAEHEVASTAYEEALAAHEQAQRNGGNPPPSAPAPKPVAPKPVTPVAPAPVAPVAEAPAPKPAAPAAKPKAEPAGVTSAREQLAKLEASGNANSPQAKARRKYIRSWEKDNGLPYSVELEAPKPPKPPKAPTAEAPAPAVEAPKPKAPVATEPPVAETPKVEPPKETPVEDPADNYDPVTEPNPKENPKDVAEREALTAKENPADTKEPTAKEVETQTTKNIIKGLEDQIAKAEKAGRGDSKQAKKQRKALEVAKKKLAELEGKTEEPVEDPTDEAEPSPYEREKRQAEQHPVDDPANGWRPETTPEERAWLNSDMTASGRGNEFAVGDYLGEARKAHEAGKTDDALEMAKQAKGLAETLQGWARRKAKSYLDNFEAKTGIKIGESIPADEVDFMTKKPIKGVPFPEEGAAPKAPASEAPKPEVTPERQAKIDEAVGHAEATDVSNTYTVEPVIKFRGSDGKLYGANGFPAGVKNTGERVVDGYGIRNKDGVGIGKRFATEAEAKAFLENGRKAKADDFRKSLEGSDDARLNDQLEFWRKQRETAERRGDVKPKEAPVAEQPKPAVETPTEKPNGNFREKKASGEPPKEEGKKRLAMVEGEGVLRLNAEGNVEIVTPEWKVTHNPETGQWESKSIGRESFETLSKKSPIEQTEATKKVAEERALEGERQREEQQARIRQEQADRTENSNWRAEVNANTPKGRKGNIDVQVSRDEGKTFGAESRPATIYGDWAVSGSGNAYEVHHVGTGLRLRGSLTREQANTLVRGLVHGGVEGKFTDNAAGGEANKAKIKDIILATVNGNKPPEYWKGKEATKAPAAEAPKAEPVEAQKSPAVEAAEKQVETINDRLAELERTKKGDSPEADALRAQRDKLQTTIDAQKPESPDVLSKAEKWADETIREINRQGRQRSGLDPELLAAYAVKGAVKFARSLKDFKEFSREMVNEFGNGIRPHLKAIFDKAQEPGLAREYAEQQQARNADNRPEPDLAGESEKMAQLRAEERDNNRELAEGRKPVLSAGGRTWRSAIDSPVVSFFKHIGMRMRTIADNNPQSEAAQKLVNDFSLIPGTKETGRDYNTAHSNERTKFLNKFSIALGPVLRDMRKMSAADLVKFNDLFIQALEGRIKVGGETGEAVKRVQEVMDELHAYGKEAGIDMGKVTDYFPRMINAEMVMADRAGFEEAAARAYERQWERLQKEAKDNQSEFGFAEETTQRPNFKEMARKWAEAIELNQEGFDFERGIFDEGNAATKENFQKNREFTKEEAAEFDAFRQKDFETVLTNHIGAMARRAEVARRLGADGMEWTKIASKLAEEAVSAKDIEQLKKDIQSNLGIGETLLSETGQNTQNTYNLVSTTAFLKLTGLLNVAEPGSIGIRERDPVQGAKAMISNLFRIRNVLTRMSPGEAKSVKTEIERIYGKGHDLASALAIELGINHIDHGLGSLSSGFHLDAGTDAGGQIRRVNDNVYRLYGIHATEVAKRETSIKHGMQFIDKSIQFFEGNSNLQRIFRAMGKNVDAQTLAKDRIMELGIKEADVPAFMDFAKTLRGMDSNQQLKAIMSDSPMAAEYRKALQIFNKQSSVQATRSSRQEIANQLPIGKALFQFATYTNEWASQHGRYMLETAKKVRNSDGRYNASERLLAAGVAPAFAMATAGMFGIRHIINKLTGFQFEDSEAFGVKVPAWVKSMADAVVYTGILGPAELAYKWIVRDQPPGGLLSSWINSSTKAFARVKENPESNAAQKNVAKIGYRSGFVPAANAALATASGAADLIPSPILRGATKLGAAGLAQVIANNRTENAAATAIAGEDNKGTKNPPKPTPPRPPSPPTPR